MPESSELLKNIVHYQKLLDKYSQVRDDTKTLHCVFKLFNMPVTVSHLEETGIGRTVNSLRKLGGEVEDAAKMLVRKWKQMVSGNDEADEPKNNETNNRESESNSSHKHSDKYRNSDRKEKSSRDDKYKNNKKENSNDRHQDTSETRRHMSSSSKYSQDEDISSCESENEEDCESGVASESEQSSSDEETDNVLVPTSSKYEKDKFSKYPSSEATSKPNKETDRNKKQENSHSRERTQKHELHSEYEPSKRKRYDSSSSDSDEKSSNHTHTSRDTSSSKRKYDYGASDEEAKKKISKKSSPSANGSHRSSSSHRSKESYGQKKESKSETDKSHSKSSSYKSKESSSSAREHKKERRSDSDKRESKNFSKYDSKHEKRKSESSREESKSDEKPRRDSNITKSHKKHDDEKSRSKHTSKNSTGSSGSSTSNSSSKIVDIGSESGTSFADALGMLEPTTSKPSTRKPKPCEPTSYKQEKSEKSVKEKPAMEKPLKSDKIDILIPPPPPKSDIDINIASLLPSITPNYRPVANPFVDSCISRTKIMNDDEALSLVMSQKNLRTKVYSGNKCFFGTVNTLFELCIRVLQDNIDALEYTGGVPYAILKPVLDKATPDQLFTLEHHNPYLIEDTDDLWKFHCQKEFRSKKREEMESWREMYMRCLDEREAKLKALTENIKLAQDKSIPVRQTKLAYVDSVVKPPRDVIRKQAKSGFIDKKPSMTPTARLSALATAGSAGQVVVPNPVRASSSSTSSAAVKPKKAPLMAKTLQFLKGNRFRR